MANNAKPAIGAFNRVLGIEAQSDPSTTATRLISNPIVSLDFHGEENVVKGGRGHRRMARDGVSIFTIGAGAGSSLPTHTSGPPPAPIKSDPTTTITDSGARPTLVSLALRDETHELEAGRNNEGFYTHTIKATDPQPTIVDIMYSDIDSVPVTGYAFDRMLQSSRDRHGSRKRMEGSGKIPDAEASGVRGGTGVGFALVICVGVVLLM